MRRTRHPDGFDLIATFATVVFTLAIAIAAYTGHQQANSAHDSAKSAHHMASLAEIQTVLQKAQSDESR